MTNELKPVRCGCGGEAEVVDYWSADYAQTVWYVHCKDCDIASGDYFSEAESIMAWNRAMSGNVVVYGNPDAPKSKTVG